MHMTPVRPAQIGIVFGLYFFIFFRAAASDAWVRQSCDKFIARDLLCLVFISSP